jgi:Tol biopolymer transport system component/tRNA A-37 threonylcarbamoyl transferase component Bud32
MTKTKEQWRRIKEITADALERDPKDRAAFAAQSCSDDPVILEEVLRLLKQSEESDLNFLSTPAGNLRALLGRSIPYSPVFSPGQLVSGRFEVQRFISRGGMGEVYAALDLELRETVALKTIRVAIASSPLVIKRFKEEVRQTRSIAHANVCKVYDLFSHDLPGGEPIWFLTMQYLEGRTLGDRLADDGPMQPQIALPLLTEMGEALAAAHDAGIVHRDFKPSNVMLVKAGRDKERAVVMDFGLAVSLGSGQEPSAAGEGGTPPYMAPEQVHKAAIGTAADQFAFALVVCEMLTGIVPQIDRSTPENLRADVEGWLSVQTGLPRRARRVIRRCLRFRPEDRFADIRTLLSTLAGRGRRALVRGAALGVAALVPLLAVVMALGDSGDQVQDAVQLTADTDLSAPFSLSRDGQWIAYTSDRAERGSANIWLQQIHGGPAKRLTASHTEDTDPSVSPDGKWVAFRSERDGGGLYVVSSAGGDERLLAPGGQSPAFSPDGRFIAYWSGSRDDAAPSGSIYLVSPDGGVPRRLAADFSDARFPVWNTDTNLLLFEGCRNSGASLSVCHEWWAIDPKDNTVTRTELLALLSAQRLELQSPPILAWRANHLYFSAVRGSLLALWELPLSPKDPRAAGAPRRITSGDGNERDPSIAANGVIAFGRISGALHIWEVPFSSGDDPEFRVTDNPASDCCPSIARDGERLLFTRKLGDFRQILSRDLKTGQETTLSTSQREKFWPIADPTGERIAFEARSGNASSIDILEPGGSEREVCGGCSHPTSWFTENYLFYTKSNGEIALLDTHSGSSTVALSGRGDLTLGSAEWSPLHHHLLFTASKGGTSKQAYTVQFPSGGQVAAGEWTPVTAPDELIEQPHWSQDGKVIVYLSKKDGHTCVWGRQFNQNTHSTSGLPFAIKHYHDPRMTPERTGPLVRGLAVGKASVFLNVGEVTETVWLGAVRSPLLTFFRQRP